MKTSGMNVCSRGHWYEGPGPCPICWPGGVKRRNVKRFVALLRGINVGGNNLIKMADLKQAVEACGFANVRTFIQSGNVVFESASEPKAIAKKLETMLSKRFKTDLRVVVRTERELAAVLKRAPDDWKRKNDLRRYVAFVREPKTAKDVVAIAKPREGVDKLAIGKGVVYMSTKFSERSKSGLSKLMGQPIYKDITIRDYATVEKLSKLLRTS